MPANKKCEPFNSAVQFFRLILQKWSSLSNTERTLRWTQDIQKIHDLLSKGVDNCAVPLWNIWRLNHQWAVPCFSHFIIHQPLCLNDIKTAVSRTSPIATLDTADRRSLIFLTLKYTLKYDSSRVAKSGTSQQKLYKEELSNISKQYH